MKERGDHLLRFARLRQSLAAKFLNRLAHRASRFIRAAPPLEQAGVDEGVDPRFQFVGGNPADALRRVEGEAAAEDAGASTVGAIVGCEEVVAPGDAVAEP